MPTAYSYIRFSTPQQKLGNSLIRQLEASAAWATANNFTLDDTMRDEGLSGYHGKHLAATAHLGNFLKRIEKGQITRGSVLIVEHLDRLGRDDVEDALARFIDIKKVVDIVTLMDGQRYSKGDHWSKLLIAIVSMATANEESAKKADRTRDNWIRARGTASALTPSWITADGKLDRDKSMIVRRLCCDLLLNMGFDKAAHVLNAEGVPTLGRPRSRSNAVWDGALVGAIAKSPRVLGHQPIGKYIDGKRHDTGQVVKNAYKAVITEDEWYTLQTAIDKRKNGTAALDGRKTGQMTNLFGDIARCDVCGNRMTVYRRGRINHFYFACSVGSKLKESECSHRNYHRLDKIEARILQFFASRALHGWTPTPQTDPTEEIVTRITALRKESTKLEAAYRRAMLREGDLALKMQSELEAEHAATIKDIERLERELANIKIAKPEEEQFAVVSGLAEGLSGLKGPDLIAARAQIAAALPALLPGGIRFKPDGTFTAYTRSLTIRFGNRVDDHDVLNQYIIESIDVLAETEWQKHELGLKFKAAAVTL